MRKRERRVSCLWRRDATVPILRLTGRWLGALGFHEGSSIRVEASGGRLVITAVDWSPEVNAQREMAALAGELGEILRRLEAVGATLPASPERGAMEEGAIPRDVATELLGAVQCIAGDDLRPAIASLQTAAQVTGEGLRQQWEGGRRSRA